MGNWRLDQLKQMLKENPEDDFLMYAIAQEHLKNGSLVLARQHFEKLKTKNPGYIGLYYHLGRVCEELDLPSEALKIYEEGISEASKASDNHALSELMNAKTNLELGL